MTENRNYLGGQVLWMALLDAVCIVIGIVVSIVWRLGPDAIDEYFLTRIYGWIYYAGSIIVANYLVGSYGIQIKVSRFNLLVNWAFSVIVALVVVGITSYAWFHQMWLGRGVLWRAVAVYSALWLLCGYVLYNWVLRLPAFAYRVAVLCPAAEITNLRALVANEYIRPVHRIVAFVKLAPATGGESAIDGTPVIACEPASLVDALRTLGAQALIICHDVAKNDLRAIYPQLRRLRFEGIAVLDPLNVAEIYTGRVPLELVDENWLMQVSAGLAPVVVMRVKRVFDAVTAGVGLVLLSPVLLAVALAVKLSAPRSPVLYSQRRMGRFGQPFVMYKFRTMVVTAEEGGPAWSPVDDKRVTRLGRLLRRYRLDELPQLVNVLRGEMSMVGPRPERPELIAELEKAIPWYRERENILPGLTGWAQIRYPYGASMEDARRKLEFDLYYIKHLSLAFDLRVLLRTLRIVTLGLERTAP